MMIKMLVMDVDGTLTDGKIYIGPSGELMKAFDVKDGYAIVQLTRQGVIPVIITGRESEIVKNRARELKIEELHQGVENKLECLKQIAMKHVISAEEIAYIGDDKNDLECIKFCGISAAPKNSVDEVLENVNYICKHDGGNGAVREFIEKVINVKNIEENSCERKRRI